MANRYFFDKRDMKHFFVKYGIMLLISMPILLALNVLFAKVFGATNMVFLDIVFLCGGSAKDLPIQGPKFASIFNLFLTSKIPNIGFVNNLTFFTRSNIFTFYNLFQVNNYACTLIIII